MARSYVLTFANKGYLLSILLAASICLGAESPRFRGPVGNGAFEQKGLLKQWPEGGPRVDWTFSGLGEGYSSAVVANQRVYVTGMDQQGQGQLFCLDLDGRLVWKSFYGPEFQAAGPAPGGTRGSCCVQGGLVALVTGLGRLVVLDANDGHLVGDMDLIGSFSGQKAQFGFAECPLIYNRKVIVTPGGRSATLAAVHVGTRGQLEVVWKAVLPGQATGYCSASLVRHKGSDILLTMLSNGVVAVDPDAGQVVWWHTWAHRAGVQPNAPLYSDGCVYVCSGMGAGGALFALSGEDPNAPAIWTDRTLDCQMQGTVLVDGYIYGTAQSGNRGLVCLRWADGKVMWTAPELKMAVVVAADGLLYAYGQDGQVWLIRPNPERFEPISRFEVSAGTGHHWAHPTIAAGKLFIRHGDVLIAYNISG